MGDLPRKQQQQKRPKRRRWEMSEDESDHAAPPKTKWIGPSMVQDSDSPAAMTKRKTTEAYMQKHQTLLEKQNSNTPVPASNTARVVEKETIAAKTSKKTNLHSRITGGNSQSALEAESQSQAVFRASSHQELSSTPVPSVAPDRALQTFHTSQIPQVATALRTEAVHTTQTLSAMEINPPLQTTGAPFTPPTMETKLPHLNPKHIAEAFLPVELVGISHCRTLPLYKFDSQETFFAALQSLWELGADGNDISLIVAKYSVFHGEIRLRKRNARDFQSLMIMIAKWLDTLKPNEIAGLCPSIIIKIYKHTVEGFQ